VSSCEQGSDKLEHGVARAEDGPLEAISELLREIRHVARFSVMGDRKAMPDFLRRAIRRAYA